MEKIMFTPEGGEAVMFYVIEQTMIGGKQYILVTDAEEGDGEALILKDMSSPGDDQGIYEIVDDETEMNAVASVFENILEDIELANE